MIATKARPPRFNAAFKAQFAELVRWRRDVRRFRADPVDPRLLDQLLAASRIGDALRLEIAVGIAPSANLHAVPQTYC